MYRGAECRETLKLPHTRANIKYAERLRGEILNAIELGTFNYSQYFPESPLLKKFGISAPSRNFVTVGYLLDEQFKIYERTLTPGTYKVYRRNYENLLKKQWFDTPLVELTPAALRAWIATLTCSARSMRQYLVPLRGALDLAVNDDLIESSPMDRVKLNRVMDRSAYKVKFVTDPFSAAEIAAILDACEGQERNVFKFAFATGMRPSEYMALRWESIDWIGFTAKVERSRVLGFDSEETKTKSGLRAVDLRRGSHDALLQQKQYSALANAHVFLDPATSARWDRTGRLRISWVRILKKAGVRYRNLYQTRHTFASTLLSTGENIMYVAKQMGHADTTMITRTYGRWIEQEDDALPEFYFRMLAAKRRLA